MSEGSTWDKNFANIHTEMDKLADELNTFLYVFPYLKLYVTDELKQHEMPALRKKVLSRKLYTF